MCFCFLFCFSLVNCAGCLLFRCLIFLRFVVCLFIVVCWLLIIWCCLFVRFGFACFLVGFDVCVITLRIGFAYFAWVA